jgi:hypothetical protein
MNYHLIFLQGLNCDKSKLEKLCTNPNLLNSIYVEHKSRMTTCGSDSQPLNWFSFFLAPRHIFIWHCSGCCHTTILFRWNNIHMAAKNPPVDLLVAFNTYVENICYLISAVKSNAVKVSFFYRNTGTRFSTLFLANNIPDSTDSRANLNLDSYIFAKITKMDSMLCRIAQSRFILPTSCR